ncbi:hypothetical protein [Vagococcus intermedius]|uniref:Uncharacterized protein n=1 Tax=Vagococcus intermedius TaxID=2991418 RepID=A0AAF0CW93_9ENTE|nr:hypothetical protein [Vagococcus intermedius]WEG74029.1 hypothetical protein OL234_03790 [Vagococcus intermedius]WEG76109.1 hypothetical protein OL235_03795 [Vagococcus intermedius]
MSSKQLNLTILIYVSVVIVLLFLSYFYNNWKILISGTGVFSILMYYLFVKLKKPESN